MLSAELNRFSWFYVEFSVIFRIVNPERIAVLHVMRLSLITAMLAVSSAASVGQSLNAPIVYVAPDLPTAFHGISPPRPTALHRPKVGVVLSGGGARGLAQVGVLRTLQKHHVPIDLIVGNSMGSIVGALFASGYTTAQIESIATSVNWDEVLSFSEPTKRTDLFVGQKQMEEAGYLSVRFDGLQLVIPSSISGGQRLSDFFANLTLQALYHPDPDFDHLKIPLRTTSTDLLTGERIIFDRGSLSEAMRASVSVPLLYVPFEKDSMLLVDGGLTSNIPVDVAESLKCDVIIAVNSTSPMRRQDQLQAPWHVADQIMTIMMHESNERQLELADIVITPEVGDRIVSDFADIRGLIEAGDRAAEQKLDQILRRIHDSGAFGPHDQNFDQLWNVRFAGDSFSADLMAQIRENVHAARDPLQSIPEIIEPLTSQGMYRNIRVSVDTSSDPFFLVSAKRFVPVRKVSFNGVASISVDEVQARLDPLIGHPMNFDILTTHLEDVLELYRARNYSLARIEDVTWDPEMGLLHVSIGEGKIADVLFEGNHQTRDYVIRREMPIAAGDVFQLDQMNAGLTNIASLGLFEYVVAEVQYVDDRPALIVRVNEKSSRLLRFALHANDERGFLTTFDIRDANFRGAGEELGLTLRYGLRDRLARAEYRADRIFQTYLTFNLRAYLISRDVFTYRFSPPGPAERWERVEDGEYRETRVGGSFTFGTQLERFGNATAEIRLEKQRVGALSGTGYTPEDYRLSAVKLQTIVDTEDRNAFPTKGVLLKLSYETATKGLGSEVAFSKIGAIYESYLTVLSMHTFRYKLTIGYADKTLPTAEQYSLGGMSSFVGLHEDDLRGRQLFLMNFDYRLKLPFKILFDTYVKAKYDLGTISSVPEDLKLREFRHGLGLELGLDTPIGPVFFGGGQSFIFRKDVPNFPVSTGSLLFYFSIGPPL